MNKTSIISQLNRQDIDRLRGYRELLDFYHGRQWEGRERRGEKRLTFNYAKVFIDKVTSYLMSGINFIVDAIEHSEEAKARAQRAEAALHQVYEDNNLEQLDLETEIDCAILGDACYKVIWDAEAKKVRITAPDVQGIYAWWLGDDTSRIWKVASKYSLTAEESEFQYRVKPKGKTATIVELWSDGEFELYLDDALIEQKPNPYGFIPFIIYPRIPPVTGSVPSHYMLFSFSGVV
ncbi:MAG: phage portal protein [Dehalococcoidia bacterium]|nr:phage portal protein [Dehalococcoidia bacterium]